MDAEIMGKGAEEDERVFYHELRRIASRKQMNEVLLLDTHAKSTFKKFIIRFNVGAILEERQPLLGFAVAYRFLGSKGERVEFNSRHAALDRYNEIDIRKRIA